MADSVNNNKYLMSEPSDTEVRTVLQRIQEARRQAPAAVDTSDLDKAEEEAKRLYEERANRAEWLSLAEQLGRSFVRLNAANQGLRGGFDASGIQLPEGTDWEKRIQRYGSEYAGELGQLGKKRAHRTEEQARQEKLADQGFGDQMAGLGKEYDFSKYQYGQRMDAYQQSLRDAATEARESTRAEKKEAKDQERTDTALRTAQLRDLEQQEKAAAAQVTAAQQLANQMATDSKLSSKAQDKLEATYGRLAGQAGVDLASVQERLKAEETGPRIFGGRASAEDEKAKKAILDSMVSQTRNLLDGIRQRKQQLLQGSGAGTPQATPEAPSSGGDKVRVRNPQGQVGQIPRSQLADALSQGYTEVK